MSTPRVALRAVLSMAAAQGLYAPTAYPSARRGVTPGAFGSRPTKPTYHKTKARRKAKLARIARRVNR